MSIEKVKLPAPLTTGNTVRPLIPTDIDSAWRMATAITQSGMLPKSYASAENKIAAAFAAMQLGSEVGLTPMASIQNIAVVNGNPRIWGDAQLAIVRNSGELEYIRETYEGKEYDPTFKAVCTVKRKGQEPTSESFSVADATKAGLWNKQGPWTQYPKRMLKYRARAFALRDAFSDCLLGLAHTMEEEDVPVGADKARDITPSSSKLDAFEEQHATPVAEPEVIPPAAEPSPATANIIVTLGDQEVVAANHEDAAKKLIAHLERYTGADHRLAVLKQNHQLTNDIFLSGLKELAAKISEYYPAPATNDGGQQ